MQTGNTYVIIGLEILLKMEDSFMAYISSKEFKALLAEVVKMLEEGKTAEVITMLEKKIAK